MAVSDDPPQRVRLAFHEHYGRPPDGVFSAPGRVNLIGEHTDYNDGWVLPLAIDRRAYLAASPRTDGRLRVRSAQQSGDVDIGLHEIAAGSPAGWAGYLAGVWRVLGDAGYPVPGADVMLDSTVPLGAGLSSSAALECAAAWAVLALMGMEPGDGQAPSLSDLAAYCRRAENDVVGAPTGVMDQTAALRCRSGHALLLDTADGSIEQLALPQASEEFGLMVVDTGITHQLADSEYGQRRNDCQRAAEQAGVASLRELQPPPGEEQAALGVLAASLSAELLPLVRHVITENARVHRLANMVRTGDIAGVGEQLTASHRSLRDDYRVSWPEADSVVRRAGAAGAVGARMIGGGFGGSVLVLAARQRLPAIAEAVGSPPTGRATPGPQCWPVEASGAARREGAGGQTREDRTRR